MQRTFSRSIAHLFNCCCISFFFSFAHFSFAVSIDVLSGRVGVSLFGGFSFCLVGVFFQGGGDVGFGDIGFDGGVSFCFMGVRFVEGGDAGFDGCVIFFWRWG